MSVPVADGVRIDRLREGRKGALVLVPGLEGEFDELAGVVAGYTGEESIYCAAPTLLDGDGAGIHTVERMAGLLLAALDQVLADEECHLAGYSFGGLLVWEMARQRRLAGRPLGHVILIEAVPDERFWDRGVWLASMGRRALHQLARIARLPPGRAAAEFVLRGRRLIRRLSRRTPGGDTSSVVCGETPAGRRAYRAISQYRPGYYDGAVTVLAATEDRHFGYDTARLWRGLAREIAVRRIEADHLTIVTEPAAAGAVAAAISRRLECPAESGSGLRPGLGFETVLIVSTMRWFSTARLADAMIEAGFQVSGCRPSGHALELVDGLAGDHPLRKSMPVRSIERAIRTANPDLVLCDDERSLVLLRRLYARHRERDSDLCTVLARSLGRIEDWPRMASRTGVAEAAHTTGVAAPETAVATDLATLTRWADTHPLPLLLKTDGSCGGRGVAAVCDRSSLERAWRGISGPPAPHVAVKRALVNWELQSLKATLLRRRPTVNVQRFQAGHDAIATAACQDGEVIASACLEVVVASEPRGPAAVVRVIDHPAMGEAVRKIVRHFGLSGFCGFDFIVTPDGAAWLVDLNTRITPTCYLLLDALRPAGEIIALFPFERPKDPGLSAYAQSVDLPVRAPLLVQRGRELAARQTHPVRRRMREWTSRPRSDTPL